MLSLIREYWGNGPVRPPLDDVLIDILPHPEHDHHAPFHAMGVLAR